MRTGLTVEDYCQLRVENGKLLLEIADRFGGLRGLKAEIERVEREFGKLDSGSVAMVPVDMLIGFANALYTPVLLAEYRREMRSRKP